MISKLTGKPEIESTDLLTLEVNNVGYSIYVTPTTISKVTNQKMCVLYIYTHVRQDSLDLFGFLSKKERELFVLLITVSGIGPKTGMKIVDFGVSGITNAVLNADVSFFSQIPKVGKKSAQKIIIELKSKLGSLEELDLSDTGKETNDIIQTLTAMGFSRYDVVSVLKKIPGTAISIEDKIRYALKAMGK